MYYRISWLEEAPVWIGSDPETGEAIFGAEHRRAEYPSVPEDRLEELLADARARTCDTDSVKAEENHDPVTSLTVEQRLHEIDQVLDALLGGEAE